MHVDWQEVKLLHFDTREKMFCLLLQSGMFFTVILYLNTYEPWHMTVTVAGTDKSSHLVGKTSASFVSLRTHHALIQHGTFVFC